MTPFADKSRQRVFLLQMRDLKQHLPGGCPEWFMDGCSCVQKPFPRIWVPGGQMRDLK